MKIKGLIVVATLFLLTAIFSGCRNADPVSSADHSWQILTKTDAMFERNIGGFLNKKFGITVGYSGEIHYTKDGGKTWNKANNGSLCLFGLDIVNNKVAYACGNGSNVLKTTDGGANWSGISSFGEYEPNQPRYLSFVNEDTGWIATPNKFEYNGKQIMLGYTKNGGMKWDNIPLPEEINEISALYLRTPECGYIVDNKCNLYTTNDGCKSFTKQQLNLKNAYLGNAKFEQHVVLKFLDEKNGFIAYEDKDGNLLAARTSDGGKNWVNENVPDILNGAIYLSRDGKTMTITRESEFIKILEYK